MADIAPLCSFSSPSSCIVATGAVLVFPDGVTSQSFVISILNDGKPSRNRDVLVTLVSPVGGAVIAPGGGGLTDVVILASNRAAGTVGFSPLSRSAVVGAGTNVTLVVQRQWSALGVVQVTWNISGSGNVTQQFSAVSGTALFAEVWCVLCFVHNVPSFFPHQPFSLPSSIILPPLINHPPSPHQPSSLPHPPSSLPSSTIPPPHPPSLPSSTSSLLVIILPVSICTHTYTHTHVHTHTHFQGVNITTIVFGVINDTTPKLTTPYTVQLTSVQTLSADITTPEAVAQLDPTSLLATITVNASNYPHGVVEFQQQYVVSDQLSPVQVTLVREYGTFGECHLGMRVVCCDVFCCLCARCHRGHLSGQGGHSEVTPLAQRHLPGNAGSKLCRYQFDGQICGWSAVRRHSSSYHSCTLSHMNT